MVSSVLGEFSCWGCDGEFSAGGVMVSSVLGV